MSAWPGPGTGTAGLIPAPPISVAPSGIPRCSTVDERDWRDEAAVLPEHTIDEPFESPPPSNSALGEAALPDAAQPTISNEGLSGEMPGIAISVDPSGIPAGRLDRALNGDVAGMPFRGCGAVV
ncbi:hypothetical protein [Bradyrhizobium retamae]|uniref:hypothetical protein n=1 Tax=Bradyrhizobium retamae TaxID=1300035 RepID=UPI001FD9BEBF|nr:hypothetical protein [Bradyrhizobium retamae]